MKLVLLGAGGHCLSCLEAARSAHIEVAGVIAPGPGTEVRGLSRLGDDTWLQTPSARQYEYLVAVGQVKHSPLRKQLYENLLCLGLKAAVVVAASAAVAPDAVIGPGTVILHRAVLNAQAVVGHNVIINTGAIVEHGVAIGDHCHISTGTIVNGDAVIGPGTVVGSGAVVLQGVTIAADVVIGAGAVVTHDIDAPGTWVGVPARRVK